MAEEFLRLTRPSLQLGRCGLWRCVSVAEHDCVLHTLGWIGGMPASSRDCAGSKLAGPAPGCPSSLGQTAIWCAATSDGAHAGIQGLRSKIDAELGDVVETARRMRRKACSP